MALNASSNILPACLPAFRYILPACYLPAFRYMICGPTSESNWCRREDDRDDCDDLEEHCDDLGDDLEEHLTGVHSAGDDLYN